MAFEGLRVVCTSIGARKVGTGLTRGFRVNVWSHSLLLPIRMSSIETILACLLKVFQVVNIH